MHQGPTIYLNRQVHPLPFHSLQVRHYHSLLPRSLQPQTHPYLPHPKVLAMVVVVVVGVGLQKVQLQQGEYHLRQENRNRSFIQNNYLAFNT